MPTYVVSDVHGHALQLQNALDEILLGDPGTQLVFPAPYDIIEGDVPEPLRRRHVLIEQAELESV